MIPTLWMPAVRMDRTVSHWDAGAYIASGVTKRAYHLITELRNGVAQYVRGDASIALNSGSLKEGYAAHTRGLNTNSIGVAMACMAGAKESPFDAGKYPMTADQFEAHCKLLAVLHARYQIPVNRRTCLSHAEVQPTLGVQQAGKWDFTRLAFAPDIRGAIEIGDFMRTKVVKYLMGEPMNNDALTPGGPNNDAREPIPNGATLEVVTNGSNLTSRAGPSEAAAIVGTGIPNGTRLTFVELDASGSWVRATTPGGFTHWYARRWLKVVDGPLPVEPTQPADWRKLLAENRSNLDKLERIFNGT